MSLVANAVYMIATRGETMTLKRDGSADITLKGKRQGGTLEPAGNSDDQQQFKVLISTTELQASAWSPKMPSARGDQLEVGGILRTVLDIQPRNDGDTVAMYELTVAG